MVDGEGNTPLMLACIGSRVYIAMALIETGHSNPGHVNYNNETALIIVCNLYDSNLELNETKQTTVALALIATGQSKPGHISAGNTALTLACDKMMPEEVTLALIATKQSKPGHIRYDDDTALIIACKQRESRTALALIATGASREYHISNGYTALMCACQNGLADVIMALIEIQDM